MKFRLLATAHRIFGTLFPSQIGNAASGQSRHCDHSQWSVTGPPENQIHQSKKGNRMNITTGSGQKKNLIHIDIFFFFTIFFLPNWQRCAVRSKKKYQYNRKGISGGGGGGYLPPAPPSGKWAANGSVNATNRTWRCQRRLRWDAVTWLAPTNGW